MPNGSQSEQTTWLTGLKVILRMAEDERLLQLALQDSLDTAQKVDDEQLALALQRSLADKALGDKTAFETAWTPLKKRLDALLDRTPVSDGSSCSRGGSRSCGTTS